MNHTIAGQSEPAPLDPFQTTLLHELRDHISSRAATQPSPTSAGLPAARSARRGPTRRRVAVTAAAAASALAASGIWWSTAASSPAFAVTRAADGDVTVTVSRIDDAAGLRKALQDKGITADVQYLPWGKGCAPGRYTEAPFPRTEHPWSFGQTSKGYTFTVPAGGMPPGQTLVLELTSNTSGAGSVNAGRVALASGPVSPCTLVTVPTPHLPPTGTSGGTSGGEGSGFSAGGA